jgi:hypothetical protein
VVNDERAVPRTVSLSSGGTTRVKAFREAVRQRDRRCFITGKPAKDAQYGVWRGFEAANIFPLALDSEWNRNEYDRWITMKPDTGSAINSVQNGLLLRGDMHALFDGYDISINPDV